MANPNYQDMSGPKPPKFSTSGPHRMPLAQKTYKHPTSPGSPRRIHKPLGRKVRTSVAGDV